MDNPYKDAFVIQYDEGEVSLERREYISDSNQILGTYTVQEDDTIQNIAFRFYKDSGSWYKICDYNNIYNPFEELVPGLVLNIPKI